MIKAANPKEGIQAAEKLLGTLCKGGAESPALPRPEFAFFRSLHSGTPAFPALCCEFNYVVSFSSFSGFFLHFSSCSFSNSKIAFPFYFAALPCVRTVHALDQYQLPPQAICVDAKWEAVKKGLRLLCGFSTAESQELGETPSQISRPI